MEHETIYYRAMKNSDEKIIIIDGSSYFFRAYYAIQRLSTSKGFPTNAIYGFINMLMRVLEVEKPKKLAIAFDTGKPTFRKELYDEYKANRDAAPDDLVKQIPHIFRAVDAFGVKRLEKEGYEADDIIGTLTKRARKEGYDVDIITGDKDLMQLVDDHVTLYDSMRDRRYDPQGVFEKMQVKPDQIIDFLALMGDSSDNIPGVTGIGEKTAAELLKEYGSLDGIYENLDKIKQEKRRETLKSEKKEAYLSQKLATVHCDVPLQMDWSEMDYQGPKPDLLKPFFEEMEFNGLLKKFDFKVEEPKNNQGNYVTIDSEKKLKEMVKRLMGCTTLAIDTETTSLSIHDAKLVGVSLCGYRGESYYIPIGHVAPGTEELLPDQLDEKLVRAELKKLLEEEEIEKVGQNLKYDLQILRNFGVEVKGVAGDTLVESYLLNPDERHNLDALSFRYLGHQTITYEEVTGKGKSQISFAEVPIEKATQYSAEDADMAFRLNEKLLPLVKENKLLDLYQKVEVPLVEVLADMEFRGVCVDSVRLKAMEKTLSEELSSVEETIFQLAGGPFNINSPKQLSAILFEKLKLPVVRKTKTGFSTDESVLQELSSEHAICKHIVKYRELGKLRSTYVEGLLQQIHPKTGRVHTNFNQTVTATGRLSSSNPNLQNIPTEADPKYDIRCAFVPREGFVMMSADYSQVELRLLADMSGDEELLRAFQNDEDIHEYTARLIFGSKTVSADQRKVAKTINFGVVYGQTPYGLSQTLGVSPSEAKQFIETYFKRYKGVRKFVEEVLKDAREKGFVCTRLGRRRYISEINSSNRMRKEMAERAAFNMPLQGTAADMIKIAMVSLHHRLLKEGRESKMILQVHDELVLEVKKSELEAVQKALKEEMENALKLKIPLKVAIGTGKTWRDC